MPKLVGEKGETLKPGCFFNYFHSTFGGWPLYLPLGFETHDLPLWPKGASCLNPFNVEWS